MATIGSSAFKTVHASVRPHRVAVLTDKNDSDWQETSLRIIEFFSRLWGGAHDLIIPTDGKTIDDRFWAILEVFDPDYLYVYRKSGEDMRLSDADRYRSILDSHVAQWMSQFGQGNAENAEQIREEIDRNLRDSVQSDFAISPELQKEIKVRLAPFWFQEWVVEAGAIGAAAPIMFPLTDITKIIVNTDHGDEFASISVPPGSVPRLYYAAVCGAFNEEAVEELEGLGFDRQVFDFDAQDMSQLTELVVTGEVREHRAHRAGGRNFFQINGILPFQLSMLQLGLYRPARYQYWTEPSILVAGNRFDDFCLYYCLSRLRDGVHWVLPSITDSATSADARQMSSVEISFVSRVRSLEMSQGSGGGLAWETFSLTDEEIRAVFDRVNTSPLGNLRSPFRRGNNIPSLIALPITAVERDNFQRDIIVQLSDDLSISPFNTPKPKNFRTIHPYEHRYITQLAVAGEAPPKHWHLGNSVIVDSRMTTHEARVGKDGPAYFCPNVAYFGGDIDSVLVRPHLRLPSLSKVLAGLTLSQGYECRPSDKGIYADETITKWGGLAEVGRFLRNDAKRTLLDLFLDKSKSEAGKGVYLSDDQRRYLDFRAVRRCVGKAATEIIDELVTRQVLYRGFIFRCSYCRNSTWFAVGEVTQEFRCKRCGRSQVYTKTHWKAPHQPSWFFKLDELVYQGYRQNMAVPLLALDYLRSKGSENFSFCTDREFWEAGESRAAAEADFFCVSDGVLTIGEAKKEDRLGKSNSEENGAITKYKRLAAGLCARRFIIATFSKDWNANTRERVIAAFRDIPSVSVTFLTSAELLGAGS